MDELSLLPVAFGTTLLFLRINNILLLFLVVVRPGEIQYFWKTVKETLKMIILAWMSAKGQPERLEIVTKKDDTLSLTKKFLHEKQNERDPPLLSRV